MFNDKRDPILIRIGVTLLLICSLFCYNVLPQLGRAGLRGTVVVDDKQLVTIPTTRALFYIVASGLGALILFGVEMYRTRFHLPPRPSVVLKPLGLTVALAALMYLYFHIFLGL